MARETAQITPAEIIVEEWLRQDLQIEPGREFGIALLRLKRQLNSRKIGILIWNLHSIAMVKLLDRNVAISNYLES
jgi:hypothetical protein